MRRLKQVYRHDPDNGVFGDCYRTALACVLDYLDPKAVPHFYKDALSLGTRADAEISEWLSALGLMSIAIPYTGYETPTAGFEYWAAQMRLTAPDVRHVIVSGKSKIGVDHCMVLCIETGELWDPSLDDNGIVAETSTGHYWIEFIVGRL